MKTRIVLGFIFMLSVFAVPANASGKGDLQKYFSDTAVKVKAADDVSVKRAILNDSFQSMSKALNNVKNSGLISDKDLISIDNIKTSILEKQNELNGINGYERVTDLQLNEFSNYVVQDMEQADQLITISLVTLILLAILLVLIV